MKNHRQLKNSVKLTESKQFKEALAKAFKEISNFANKVREEENANRINYIAEEKRFKKLVISSIEAMTEPINFEMANIKIQDAKEIIIGELITEFCKKKFEKI